MKKLKTTHLLSSIAFAALLGGAAASAQAQAATEVVQPLEGVQVTAAEISEVLGMRGMADSQEIRSKVAMELAVRKLVRDAAQAEGYANRPDVQQKTREAATEILVDTYLSEKSRPAEVSDAQARQEYDAIVQAMAPQDTLLRLIAVRSSEKNDAVAAMFKRGAKFEDVAAQHSDLSTKANGGLMPWLNLKDPVTEAGAYGIPGEVVKVALALPKGQQSKSATVVDGVSYYVKVEDKRKANVAPFEKIKDDLKQRMEEQSQQQKVREVVAKLIQQKKAAPQK
ncbi:peptidylprolyl isomerase [Hydrogenophaga laconesensis]|uniref:peptidylprolyl isomerase n=1 Tax=Hydrogenophaga laconesensis TaxID=1805971 RepID=A0ABU1VDM6_9BURK|nr:peptidyl-prolyl cis-trans isomerase [Hydrogenophaga laconesensis]MDR7095278.1 peptidyl-prolyl cis-trans isomerase C [Hydrogenophaga laconesensis]